MQPWHLRAPARLFGVAGHRHDMRPYPVAGHLDLPVGEPETAPVCCAVLLAFGIGPRIAVVLVWIFGNRVELAFDSWWLPLLGLIVLPWTTLMYLIAWSWSPGTGVTGLEWILVVLGVAFDLMTYGSRQAKSWSQQRAY